LFLQTKFTPLNGQDQRVPYDPDADVKTQVRQSFESSLEHLNTDHIDSYLLHGPYSYPGLGDDDWAVWSALEELQRSGRVGMIGISNVNYLQLTALLERATIKPAMVQNRCYASQGWDREVREICSNNGVFYQGFSLLTANVPLLRHAPIVAIARKLGVDSSQVIFRFAMQVGMIPLTGTTNEQHMKEDLGVNRIALSDAEVSFIESIAG
jgi:diketogulonate reductase-like aldo/keto reductase